MPPTMSANFRNLQIYCVHKSKHRHDVLHYKVNFFLNENVLLLCYSSLEILSFLQSLQALQSLLLKRAQNAATEPKTLTPIEAITKPNPCDKQPSKGLPFLEKYPLKSLSVSAKDPADIARNKAVRKTK